jgi:prophage antirepressor-like protein/very-short-patch-repair endonuclease
MASFTFDADKQLIVSNGKNVKIISVGDAGDPWFRGNDVADLLGYADHKQAVKTLVVKHRIKTLEELIGHSGIEIERPRTLQAREKTKQPRIELKLNEITIVQETKRNREEGDSEIATIHKAHKVSTVDNKKDGLIKHMPDVHTISYKNHLYYKVNDVASILGYSDLKQAGRTHIPAELRFRGKDIGLCSNQNTMATTYTSEDGVASLIQLSRLPNSVKIAKAAGLSISAAYKRYHHETHYIGVICRAFRGHNIQKEHTVGEYRVDLFFSKYRLIMECDERGHASYDAKEDKRRSNVLTRTLDASWIRFDPDESGFCIIDILNKIHVFLVQFNEKCR